MPETTTRPHVPPVSCPSCQALNSAFDQYCGWCGQALSTLSWRPAGSADWRTESGKLAVAEGDTQARIELHLDGAVARAFVLQDPIPEDSRRWIDDAPLRDQLFEARTDGEVLTLEIPLHRDRLDDLFAKERSERLDNQNERLARLPLLTSRMSLKGDRYSPDRLLIDFVIARKPWVEPGASLYRFLPIERLREGGIDHLVTLHDEATAEPVEIAGFEAVEDPTQGPAVLDRIPSGRIVEIPRAPSKGAPGRQPKHLVRLHAPGFELPGDRAGWFSFFVVYDLLQGSEKYSIHTRISGVVGRGPTLEMGQGDSRRVSRMSPSRHEEVHRLVKNPGHLPVRLVDLEVLTAEGQPVEARDWLIVEGLTPGEVLGPGDERTLRLRFNRRARPPRELNEERSFRKILLRHDGWQTEKEARQLEISVEVVFGSFDVHRTLGIDFGTSSSVVCLMGNQRGFPLELEKTGDRRHTLASLMYFDHNATSERQRDIFLFGQEARNASRNAPANLVRSIKTIVAENAEARYLLLKERQKDNIFFESRTAQELLDRFITELVELAEEGASTLGAAERAEASIGDAQLSFRHAVFSHPVDVTESMKRALMNSAHVAFLNEPYEKVDQFFGESCVDEATAAVLAYVWGRLFGGVASGSNLLDDEKVICFDMGGGTTDLAAVEIEEMDRVFRREAKQVTVRPVAQGGDRRFGGDLIDRRIAQELVLQIREESEKAGRGVQLEEIHHAIRSRSFTNFQIGYKERASRAAARRGEQANRSFDAEAYDIYQLAVTILQKAEALKRSLSDEDVAEETVASSHWPLHDGAAGQDRKSDEFTLVLDRETLAGIIHRELEPRFKLLNTLVERAGWRWSDLTTLLFTGQSVRSPVIRELVVTFVKAKIGALSDRLTVIEPGTGADEDGRGGFDPKLCVAIGAAIWGISRQAQRNPWVRIDKERVGKQLAFDLTYGAPFFEAVEGLEHGTPLPATAVVEWPSPKNYLELFKDGSSYVRFHFDAGQRFEIEVQSPTEIFLTVDGRAEQKIEGKIQR